MSENQNFKNKELDLPEEINFKYLFNITWKNRLPVILISFFTFIAVFFYALSLPTNFMATGSYSSDTGNKGTTIQNPLSGLGLGGFAIGGDDNKIKLALRTLRSKKFLKDFIIKRDLASKLALEMTKEEISSLSPQDQEQFLLSLAIGLNDSIVKSVSRLNDFFTVSVIHSSPIISKQLLDWLIEDINKAMMEKDVEEAKKSIEYLKLQASKTSVGELRKLFYSMIESHTTTIMLSEVKKEYIIKTIDPPVLPLSPYGIDKIKILIWGAIGSLLLSIIFVNFLYFLGYELRFKNLYRKIKAKID